MFTVQVTVEGIADILFNRMTEEAGDDFRGGKSAGDKTDSARRESAARKVYVDEQGLYLPAWTCKKVILEGAHVAGLKLNRKPLRQRLAATLFVQGVGRFVTPKGKPVMVSDYMHETWGRTPPGPRGKLAIVRRPALKTGWRLTAEIAVLDDGVPVKALRESLDAAGPYIGIGSWRPEHGRFHVIEFKEING